MRYQSTTEESAEILRLILPRVARHGGAYVPTTYTVWFEYLSGLNARLAAALDARLQRTDRLSQTDLDHFYEQHIHWRERQTLEQFQRGLVELLDRLGAMAASSGDGMAVFARGLTDCREQLGQIRDSGDLGRVIDTLLQSTAAALGSAEALQREVATTRNEVVRLRGQLGVLENEAAIDPLTQLYNRRGLQRAIDGFLTGARAAQQRAVLIADIDHFKKINDRYGHLFGDQVLRSAAQIIRQCIKGRDVAARWGGEEFLILLPDTSGDGAVALAEQIRAAFGRARIRRGERDAAAETVTVSLGVAVLGPDEALERAIERADRALYCAKDAGRNCVRVAALLAAP
ncbi:MAG: GGDEF domain-containing protein [Gammaproteobacteria bacterium]|nr:GGDEF domain-containing protein [Gammaproteobacteria bacterium]